MGAKKKKSKKAKKAEVAVEEVVKETATPTKPETPLDKKPSSLQQP